MKLHYSNILLFSIPLNILMSSSYAHNKNKPYVTPHTLTIASRVLSECELYMPNNDNDPDMKSVKENFDRQTSQRFEEHEERMKDKRKKCKEQCEKDIQKIILKDKMEKSLAEKVEIGCLMCGYGLGGVAASVGIFGALAVNIWTKSETAAAIDFATQEGIKEGMKAVIANIKKTEVFTSIWDVEWPNFINGSNYNSITGLVKAVMTAIDSTAYKCPNVSGPMDRVCNGMSTSSDIWLGQALTEGTQATTSTTESVRAIELGKVTAESTKLYSAIGYSVLAIFIILLVMVIIYFILRYRRKKKMNKKLQYTKLLNQ
ncbi:PIR protein, pseudogene, putative [Plasmodium sp.]|nr:PIR protein, pseudogene, putative [Plasmodium sp.]